MGKFIVFAAIVSIFVVVILDDSTPESRRASESAKYHIESGISDYYVNSYTQTNGVVTFHDILRNEDVTLINQSFTVKANK